MTTPITGYAEGFYGRLLGWAERARILATLQSLGMNTYYYAPKEDPWHRFDWRTPYPAEWHAEFQGFCNEARQRDIRVVAGVAPGLDFDFSHLPEGDDFKRLVSKCALLLGDGANAISLLMDDIDTDFSARSGVFNNEGEAHAALANALGVTLGITSPEEPGIWVTPRIYADELIDEAPDYLPMFIDTLAEHHTVLYCGSDVVSQTLDGQSHGALCKKGEFDQSRNTPKHRVVLWDNLYANDYCPRRLFVGAWRNRVNIQHVLLNPTGMVNTDCLLLTLMADGLRQMGTNDDELDMVSSWRNILSNHSVPEAFFHIAPYFDLPVFNSSGPADACTDSACIREAIEDCLWRWKTPLSREWYGAIFGLKHDLLTLSGEHAPLRIHKTQNAPLARALINRATL